MENEHNFVLMRFDDISLAFPRSEILAVEALSSVRRDEPQVPAMGTLALDDQEFPVYALSKEFDFMHDLQQDRRFCVCLETPNTTEGYALACDSVEQYTLPNDMAAQELPEFMRMLHSPIRGMFRVESGLALVCTAESMRSYVETGEGLDG